MRYPFFDALLFFLTLIGGIHAITGPHAALPSSRNSAQESFVADLLDEMWFLYKDRVPHVGSCEALLGNQIVNDHIAFRTFGGIHKLSCIFEALGYEARGCYNFPDKHLTAIHYEHRENKDLPKLFISELKMFELKEEARIIIAEALATHRPDISSELLARLYSNPTPDLLPAILDYLDSLPWKLPTARQVKTLNVHSQYAAWVLVHGYRVNHFTALIGGDDNKNNMSLDDVQAQFLNAGIPMKTNIEGEVGSKLRQTSTKAGVMNINVMGEDGVPAIMPWPYAYMEFAERNMVVVDGIQHRFEGFLGAQATELFDMTKSS